MKVNLILDVATASREGGRPALVEGVFPSYLMNQTPRKRFVP